MAEDTGGAPDPTAQGGDGGGSGQDGAAPPPDGGGSQAPGGGDGGAGDGADLPDFLKAGDDGVPAWMRDQLSPDNRAYIQKHGIKSPDDAITALIGAERLIGGDKMPAPPKDAKWEDLEKWEGWSRLGVPEKEDAYEVSPPEGREVNEFETKIHEAMRPAFHKAKLTPDQAAILERAFFEYNDHLVGETKARSEEGMAALDRKWGDNKDANVEVGRRALTTFLPKNENGELDTAVVDQVEKLLGTAATVELFYNIGAGIQGDGSLAEGLGGGGAPSTSTPEGANAELKKIYAAAAKDEKHPYVDRAHPEHKATVDKVSRLMAIAHPGQAAQG